MTDSAAIKSNLQCKAKLTHWKIKEGTTVYDGRQLLLYEELVSGKKGTIKSKSVGKVTMLFIKEGDEFDPGDKLLEIKTGCSHPTVICDLCAECGADLQKEGTTSVQATVPMVHSVPSLKQALRIGQADKERLVKDRKLVLLVDLDQTLIHTTHENIPNNIKDIHHFQLYESPHWYHTRLRPGTMNFLKNISEAYELHICTFGVRPYAHTVARILDSNGSLFQNRILSRDECFDSNSKFANLQALFPCGSEMVCIIDDREDVWNFSPNLVQVKPYHFFKNIGDIHDPDLHNKPMRKPESLGVKDFISSGLHLKEVTENEKTVIEVEESDDYLLYLEPILRKIHGKYYESFDKKIPNINVKEIIQEERSRVLADCEFVVTGLAPFKNELPDTHVALMASRLGAKIVDDFTPNTTHLISVTNDSPKIAEAKKKKILVVSPYWLISCTQRWEHVEEKLFFPSSSRPPKQLNKDLPQFINLSKEEMEEMANEVDDFDEDMDDSSDNYDEQDPDDSRWLEELEDGLNDF